MPRATNAPASRERRKRVLDKAKGYRGRRSKLFRYAKDAVMRGQYWAYRDRKNRKRMFRYLWIQRINAACRAHGLTYSRFIEGLTSLGLGLDRKVLSDIAITDETAFKGIVERVVAALDQKIQKGGVAVLEEELQKLGAAALAEIGAAGTEAEAEGLRVKYLGRAGTISAWSERMKGLSKEEKPRIGKLLNETRNAVTAALEERRSVLEAAKDAGDLAGLDVSLPGTPVAIGALHPITLLRERAIGIFRRMGFALADGPDVETEWHCFDALNTPPEHPARNEQDTFYLPDGMLLRTHTSTVQIRTMESAVPPVRIVATGAAYRRDEADATHLAQFNQMEGLYVDRGVSVADLKGTIEFFFRELLGAEAKFRFRPHFFPFTEPSFEVDVQAPAMGGKWLELAGCGMVDPAVFAAMNAKRGDLAYDPEEFSGFAFGFGVDRLTMVLSGVPDVRAFGENDVRFLSQFR